MQTLRHSLRNVYAMFTQRLRQVYAGLRSSGTCCLLRKPFQAFLRFTHGLRRFTHIVRKPKYVYAEFTQVYAYVGLRTGQFADDRESGNAIVVLLLFCQFVEKVAPNAVKV
jgi:hypothetical protein